MNADDTSRDALVEQVRQAVESAIDRDYIEVFYDHEEVQGYSSEDDLIEMVVGTALAAVVMPLVEERDRLQTNLELVATSQEAWDRLDVATPARIVAAALRERDAAIKRAEAAEAEVKRLRIGLAGAHEDRARAVTALVAERDTARDAHQALTDAVRGLADEWDRSYPSLIVGSSIRAVLTEHGAKS